MIEILLTLILCAVAAYGLIVCRILDDITVYCYGSLLSVAVIAGAAWAASFSQRAGKNKFLQRLIALVVGWSTGLGTVSLFGFALSTLIVLPATALVGKDLYELAGFVLAYGLGSLLLIPAMLMEKNLRKRTERES